MHDEKRCNAASHLGCGSVQKSWREKHAEAHWFRQTPARLIGRPAQSDNLPGSRLYFRVFGQPAVLAVNQEEAQRCRLQA